ncbi:MAG: hypothetical protein V4538_15330 [Bacteroidota bacterium]
MATKKAQAAAAKAVVEQKQTLLEKLASSLVVSLLEHEFLSAQVGKKIFGGKGTVIDAGEKAVGIKVKFSDGLDYTFTITRN